MIIPGGNNGGDNNGGGNNNGGDTGPDGFCKLPPHVTRRTVAIWTPELMKPVTKSCTF